MNVTTASTATALREAIERKDQAAYTALFAEDIQFLGPTEVLPFTGIQTVSQLLGVVFNVFEDFHYVDQVDGDGVHVLIFRARVGDTAVEGVDVLRLNDQGLIDQFTVMMRPLAVLQALSQQVGTRMDEAYPDEDED